MNAEAPAIVIPGGFTITLPNTDGHPDRMMFLHGVTVGAQWRYTLDSYGQIERIDHTTAPGSWRPWWVPNRS